eukprot:COSAG02_NODE_4957_length_4782_cov_2.868674_2_plen_259_part_00
MVRRELLRCHWRAPRPREPYSRACVWLFLVCWNGNPTVPRGTCVHKLKIVYIVYWNLYRIFAIDYQFSVEKQHWRDGVGTCLATRFNDETWHEQLALPVMRLTRSTLPTLSAWSPVSSSATVGASALVLGIMPFALATKNFLAVALTPCALLISTIQALPMLQVSAECNALRAALNDIQLECWAYSDEGVDLDSARGKNVQRVLGVLGHLERLNSGQGPGVVGCGGLLITKRLYVGWLACLAVVAAGWAVGFTYVYCE